MVRRGGYFAAGRLLDGERLEHIVDFRRLEIETRGFAGGEFSGALEITDAVLVKHNLSDRQVRAQSRGRGYRQNERECVSHHIHELDTTSAGASHFEE